MPSRKEIQWSQLKVGALVLVALALLIAIIFLMTASSGGLFAHKVELRCYFPNAGGLKDGAVVSLEGVTIGNVIHTRVVPARNPNPVEVTMQVGERYLDDIHTDSVASIQAAGVLGDSFVDIDSTHASGPRPANGAELQQSGSPTIQSVINTSQVSIQEINVLIHKIETLVDTLNHGHGTAAEFLNDPTMAKNIGAMANNLKTISDEISSGKGSLGELINDDTLYKKLDSAVDNLNSITADLQAGKGTAGKLLKDETLYNNLNGATANLKQITDQINAGKGSLGKLVKDPDFAKKLDDTITNLDEIAKSINAGEGSAGQLVKNRQLYDHLDQTADQAQQLIKAIRQDPKKYLVIQMKVF
ncbi:MAG TPA: MlaD family protein [Terracidiphilus sp.]|nr:MlaD family protein [Terracidiphilus sp.]